MVPGTPIRPSIPPRSRLAHVVTVLAEVGGTIDPHRVPLKADIGVLARQLNDHPGQFAVGQKHIAAAAQETVRNSILIEQADYVRQRIVAANKEQVGGASDLERGFLRERYMGVMLDPRAASAWINFGSLIRMRQ